MTCHVAIFFSVLGICVWIVQPASAATLGMFEDFQDGTVGDWTIDVEVVPDAGPNGSGDNALQVNANGLGGSGSRLLAQNLGTWLGDFASAGITRIALDVRNPNTGQAAFDLALRIGVAGPTGVGGRGGTGDTYVTDPFTIPADDAWHEVVFDLTADGLNPVGFGTDAAGALANVTNFRILHNLDETYVGALVAGSFLVDNITALGPVIPEPTTQALLIGCAITLLSSVSRRRRT